MENNSLFDEFLSMIKKMDSKKDESVVNAPNEEVLKKLKQISDSDIDIDEQIKKEELEAILKQKKTFRKHKRYQKENLNKQKIDKMYSDLIATTGSIDWSHSSFGGIIGRVNGKKMFSITKGLFLYTIRYKKLVKDDSGCQKEVIIVKSSTGIEKLKKIAEDDIGSILE